MKSVPPKPTRIAIHRLVVTRSFRSQTANTVTRSGDTKLIAFTSNRKVQGIRVRDLRLIRQHLDNVGLDWEAAPYPPTDPESKPISLRLEVRHNDPTQAEVDENQPQGASPGFPERTAASAVRLMVLKWPQMERFNCEDRLQFSVDGGTSYVGNLFCSC